MSKVKSQKSKVKSLKLISQIIVNCQLLILNSQCSSFAAMPKYIADSKVKI